MAKFDFINYIIKIFIFTLEIECKFNDFDDVIDEIKFYQKLYSFGEIHFGGPQVSHSNG